MTLPELAIALRRETTLPVLDRTGLKGFYEVSLAIPGAWLKGAQQRGADGAAPEASDPDGVDISKSIEKLGLKLEKGKAPIEHLVVEHIDRLPTEN